MYNPEEKIKLEVSKCLKRMNKEYRRNYTVQDLADKIGVSRESLSRLTTDSSFSLIYSVASAIYELYPECNNGEWNLVRYIEYLAWDNHSFLL